MRGGSETAREAARGASRESESGSESVSDREIERANERGSENQRMSMRNLCLEFLWLDGCVTSIVCDCVIV